VIKLDNWGGMIVFQYILKGLYAQNLLKIKTAYFSITVTLTWLRWGIQPLYPPPRFALSRDTRKGKASIMKI